MAIDSAFLDELRNRISLTGLISRRCRLARSGRNWKTCCPFHGEKTPSFHIYDDHYHCFGCGAHGDAVTWVMQTEGTTFPEAVERLASEAGMDVPKADPRQAERAREAQTLNDVLEGVQKLYRRFLYEPQGRAGLAYLRKRGLTDATLEKFGLGWSGDGHRLAGALESEGITPGQLAQAGMMRVDENGELRGELFFNRVTFPIRDRKGKLVSFGGRILGDGQPKYLNGPETRIFSKRRTLFNLDRAGSAVRQGASLVVVEGYMDVIALDQAGFGGAVAPLGTALGEEQLELLWRASPAPILCLDGDQAGQRAALRACEVALPHLSVDRTLRFCRLEGGDDPDSLLRTQGVEAMSGFLASARPMAEELFALLTAGSSEAGPEERARLRKKLEELAKLIPDRALSGEYRSTLLDMFFAKFRRKTAEKFANKTENWGRGARDDGRRETFVSYEAPPPVKAGTHDRLRALCALILRYPDILPQVELAFSQLYLPAELAEVRAALLEWNAQTADFEAAACAAWLKTQGLETQQASLLAVPLPRQSGEDDALTGADPLESWWHFYGLVNFAAFEREVQSAVRDEMLRAYAQPAVSTGQRAKGQEGMSENATESGEAKFSEGLLARMRVLEALRRGEMPESAQAGG